MRSGLLLAAALALWPAAVALADDEPVQVALTLKDHRWMPAELDVPAGQRIVITIKNLDETAEEFDSGALKIEKVIAGSGEGTVRLHPLQPGRYDFMGEYHADTAQGVVVAK